MVIRSNQFGPKIQTKNIDTKNQLADMLTKGNFTRDEWNHLLCFFNISHFSSTVCSGAMAKRVQQYSGEERVTAKSRPMMSLCCKGPLISVISRRQKARGRTAMKVRAPRVRKLKKMIERGNPLSTVTCTQHATQSGMMTKLGLLKSGKLISRWMTERCNPLCMLKEKYKATAIHHGKQQNRIRIVNGSQIILEQGE